MRDILNRVANNFWIHLGVLFLLVLVLIGWPAPHVDEFSYLILSQKVWNPDYLLNDWTFSQPWPSHAVFAYFVAPWFAILSTETIAWLGRLICWLLILAALLRLGRHAGLPRWVAALCVAAWIAQDQAILPAERVLTVFEPKAVAYVFLLFALDGFLSRKTVLPAILLGLSFSFHPAVGTWAGLAIGGCLLVMRTPFRRLVRMFLWVTLFALPGLVLSVLPSMQGLNATFDDWRFFVTERSPYLFDPFFWSRRELLTLGLVSLFVFLQAWRYRADQAMRFVGWFSGFLALCFLLGVSWRMFERFDLLLAMPGRLFPPFILLFFYFVLARALVDPLPLWRGTSAVVGVLALLTLTNPLALAVDRMNAVRAAWKPVKLDLTATFHWIREHTPNGVVIISPPWRHDSFYATERAQVVGALAVPGHEMGEYRERVEALAGQEWFLPSGEPRLEQMQRGYLELTEGDVMSVVERFGGDYMVTMAHYSFPVVFECGAWKVYDLRDFNSRQNRPNTDGYVP